MSVDETIKRRVASLRATCEIENAAHQLRAKVWKERASLFPRGTPSDLIEALEPPVALKLLGFSVVTDSELGEMFDGHRRVRVAGLIDPRRKVVRVGSAPSYQEQRFTCAHELGHAVLHPGMTGLHRDRVVSGPLARKDPREAQADKFASCYLMPPRLLLEHFFKRFGQTSFTLNQDSLFGLGVTDLRQAHGKFTAPRDLSMALARATMFFGTPFDSLATFFRVSPTTMAIRLEEVGIVGDDSMAFA